MPSYKKRHYRVVERDKALDDQNNLITQENLRQLSLLGISMYILSILLSFMLGYALGKEK
ncbi:MAG: hypothetical protein ACRC1P_05745 [Cellulosilyticaceae bacterium]